MNRSRVALSLLMMVYVLSLLAVGQADDHRKRRVTGATPMKTAKPVGEASSAIAPAGDSFTYYGPDDEAIADQGAFTDEAFPYASELAETPEYLLGGSEFTAATADEFVESLGVDAPPEYQAEYLRDEQANENVAPLPPAEIAETRAPAPVDALNEELANSAPDAIDMDLSVDTVLFDTLGQADDTDEAFYAQQRAFAPSPETPIDTCPHFHGCTNGISCPLIDRCRELIQQWQPIEAAKEIIAIEPKSAPVTKPVALPESTRATCPYSGEYGPSYDLDDYGCPLAPQAPLTHPDVYGLDCDHYFGEAQRSRSTAAATGLDDYRWNCEDHDPCFEFHGAPTSATRREPVASFDEFADDESMWDCHLADPSYVPVAKPEPTLAAAAKPKAKNEPTLAPPRPKQKPVASIFLNHRGELSQLWTVSLADLLRDTAHSEGLDLAWYINVENDGLTRAPRVADQHAALLGILTRAWDVITPVAKQISRQVDDARLQWYADYGYPWDEEAFPARGFHHDLNLELEF